MSDVHFDFHGRNFVVVGASSGMGRQIAIELAENQAHVLAIARNQKQLEKLAAINSNIQIISLDVTTADKDVWKSVLSPFVERNGKIHCAVYTAGITGATPLQNYDDGLAHTIMETSLWGAVRALQVMSKRKIARDRASFVFFSSVAGRTGEKGLFAYSAAKAAVVGAMKSLSHDLSRRGQRINTLSPGYVQSAMTIRSERDMGIPENVIEGHLLGIGQPEDISGIVLFLLSDRARWITGQDFVVDGGYMRGAWN